ncbi:hypothetical protein TELCIR_12337 [Teladorsagia circumcincta]|uniref:Uncharacterized protein n=1 Tax=Teladorsagia circumcincta TaxID=45464 RepID=A0A2G9U6Z9_TELCI|nr:hypothetical protein TELCIR_12337 [Teladorsagia circumcincta]
MNTIAISADHQLIRDVGNDPGNGHKKGLGTESHRSTTMIKDLLERRKGRNGSKGQYFSIIHGAFMKITASSDSSMSSSEDSSLTRLRSASNDSRASSPLSYSQRNKDRRREERREIRSDRNGKPRNTSSSRRSPFEVSKWTDRKTTRHSPVADERLPQTMQASSVSAAIGTITPTPDDRKSGDSGFYDDVSRPPLDPPPAPPPMETLPQIPSPPPADPPSISVQHRHQSLSSGPGPSTDAAPLPPPPPSALDLLCEPDDVPILADGWSGRLAEIGSRLTDVNASLEEAHRGVAELDDQHHRHPTTSLATETTPTSSRHRQSGGPSTTHRTDSFEERLRSINQKKKSSFDDFTLNITQERILAAKPHHGSSHTTQGTPKSFGNKILQTAQRPGDKHTPQRHESMSALKSPVPGSAPSLTGRSLSVSDARKSGTPTVAHKDPSTELLAELFHNKPPTTDFRKLPKIEKKPSAAAAHPEREHHGHEQSKKHSGSLDHHKKEKEHKMRRKDDGSFETKEERAKRKEAERSKKDRDKTKDQKKDKKVSCSTEDSGSSCAGASGGLSMYDRVKRRSSAANKDDGTKKTAALQRLRDKNNERKNQKRHRIQLDSSDEEDEGPRPIRKPAESEPDDSSEEEEETVRVGKSANGNSSEDETIKHVFKEVKKKRDYSTDESGESDGGDRKQHRRPAKKISEKHKHVAKNINMEDVFGADSTDNEKSLTIEEKEKKRKKNRKDSSDENEAPKKKLTKSDKLDFESIFGPDKADKARKNEKERKEKQRAEAELKKKDRKEMPKRKGDSQESKPAKRTKKNQQSDESSASEMEIQSVIPKVEEEHSQCSITSAKVEEPAIKEEIVDVKPEEVPMETDVTHVIHVTEEVKTEQEPEEENKPSTEADSDDESTDYDDVFASALSAPASAQQDATATTFLPPVRRVSTSSSGATEPDEVSESDSDSQRSRHRAVELVDATAGYASVNEPPVANVDEATTSSDECSATKTSLTVTSLQEPPPTSYTDSVRDTTEQSSSCEQQEVPHEVVETTVQAPPVPEPTTTPTLCEQPPVDEEAKKTARGISDLQETEDAVKSIFDGDDEEEEPQYPTLVFVPGKNGAMVASAGLPGASEATLEQLLRESFVEEPILEEKPAAEKNAEVADAAKEGSSADVAPNVIVIEDDDIVEIPTSSSSVKDQDPVYTSVSQPVTANVTAPISVAIPEPRKASTPMQSPKTVTNAEQATFVPPPVVHPVKASPVPSSEYVSVLPAASPVSGSTSPVITAATIPTAVRATAIGTTTAATTTAFGSAAVGIATAA